MPAGTPRRPIRPNCSALKASLFLTTALGIESDLIPRLATAFCSGVSRTCGDCGALIGAIMGVSLALGRALPSEPALPAYVATQDVPNL